MSREENLLDGIQGQLGSLIKQCLAKDMLTIELSAQHLIEVCKKLRDQPDFLFNQLTDVCGVDYLHYGLDSFRSNEDTSNSGFSRASTEQFIRKDASINQNSPRFAVVYHLLSLSHNQRIRLKVFVDEQDLIVPSVIHIWPSADWFEREAFDLFGIVFDGHPDLRRILTDYGFKGHPFRKDFPVIGEVELRYDALKKRCVYEPVSIQSRTLVPKVIRKDNRYLKTT